MGLLYLSEQGLLTSYDQLRPGLAAFVGTEAASVGIIISSVVSRIFKPNQFFAFTWLDSIN